MPIDFRCTECGKLLRTPDNTAGREARCPACGAVSIVPTPEAPAETVPQSTPASNPFASAASPFATVDSDNSYQAPGEFDTAAVDTVVFAIERVSAPAIGLIVVGSVGLLLQTVGTFVHLIVLAGGNRPPDDVPLIAQSGVQTALGILGIVLSVVVIIGGAKMKRLENYPLALIAAVVAIIPCFSPCCFLGVPFGIWAIVVLANGDVKAAFR